MTGYNVTDRLQGRADWRRRTTTVTQMTDKKGSQQEQNEADSYPGVNQLDFHLQTL